MPNASPSGLTSALLRGEVKASPTLPLHEAVRRELDERDPLPLPFVLVVLPPFVILSMLANLCIVIGGGGDGDWYELFMEGIEGFSVIAALWAARGSTGCSTDDDGVGTKNFGLAVVAGLMEGTAGDWNKFAGFPPPWLKVSTYLTKNPKK